MTRGRNIFPRFHYGNATASSEELNCIRVGIISDDLGVPVGEPCKGTKGMLDKASGLPITARHASHLTRFISKSDAALLCRLRSPRDEKKKERITARYSTVRTFAHALGNINPLRSIRRYKLRGNSPDIV